MVKRFSRGRKILGLLNIPTVENEEEFVSEVMDIDSALLGSQDQDNIITNMENIDPSNENFDLILSYLEKPQTSIPVEMNNNITTKQDQTVPVKESQKSFPLSLVPDYDSESSIEDEKTEANAARRSSTSSSSSSSSSESSSDSDSSTSSDKFERTKDSPVHFQELRPGQIANDSSAESSQDDIIENTPEKDQSKYSRDELQPAINSASRRCCFNSNLRTISPIYTDESDVDDDVADPTFVSEDPLTESRRRMFNIVPETSSSSDSESEIEIEQKGRKRTRRPQKWKQNKVKRLRNLGEEYVSISKTKKTIPSRCLKIPCGEKCRLKCSQNISTEERYEIFRNFWKLGDLSAQRAFINSSMVDLIPKYKYTNAEKPRAPNKTYYLTSNNVRIRVCKLFFKSTLDVTDRMIHTIQHKKDSTGIIQGDLRGKHGNHRQLSKELVEDIRKHIDSIPRIESHYVRATTSRQYIDGSKTIKDLYEDFVQNQIKKNKETGNYMAFYKIFTMEFNLSFFQPRKDQCDLCTSYTNLNGEQRNNDIEEVYEKHLKEKELSRREKFADRQNIDLNNIVAIYDLEAVLQCPRGTTSAFYYKSKLNSYNLTLTELENNTEKKEAYKNVNCYFWSESDAKRGAIEIGSCVWHYLNGLSAKAEDTGNKNVIFYSDNCCGQNKNKYNACLYLFAVQTLNIDSITHKFLIRGHTQNEADSVHSLIEKEVKKNLKSGPIYSPDQYITLIKNAKKSRPPINVHELTYDSFFDTKKLQENMVYNFNVNIEGESVNWNDIKQIKVSKENPFTIYYKTSYEQETCQKIDIRNKRKKMPPINSISLEKAYTGKQELSDNKKKDLRELLNKGLIPSYYQNIYDSILSG